jgi:two-component system, cell cycle sensor histidine kinase and response regulator CckA
LSDVTDWVRTEEDLRGCRERLERLVEERTAELRADNDRLRREIEGRRRTEKALRRLHKDLAARLAEAGEALRAIRGGEVDALLVTTAEGERVYTLAGSERPYRILIEAMGEGALTLSRDGTILYANRAFAGIVGMPLERILGAKVQEFLPAREGPEPAASFAKAVLKGHRQEAVLMAETGEEIPVLLSSTPLPESDPPQVCCVVTDLSAPKRTDAFLKESEERFRRLFDQSPLGTALVSPDFRFLRVNEAFCRITGYSAGEMASLDFPAITHPEDLAADVEQARRLLAGKIDQYVMEKRYIRKDGSIVWVRLHVRGIRDEGGRFLYFLPVVEDITERKEAEAALRRLATAVEHAGEAIVVTDAAGSIEYVNPAFEQITGYGRDETVGRNPGFLNSDLHDRSSAGRMREALSHGEEWRGRFVNRRKDGTVYHEEATISPVKDAAGKIVNFVAVKHDITHEVTLENQLRHSQKMEAVGQLAGGIAHDFNNILTALMGYATILQMKMARDEPLKLHVDQVLESVHRGAALTRSLLAFSRKQILRPRPVDLNEIVGRVGKLLARLIGEDVELRMDLSPGKPIVNADSGQIEQVLLNLATNARDAMPNGGVLTFATGVLDLDGAFIRTHGYGKPGRYGFVAVSDTGMGMTGKILDKIFEPFFTTKEVGKGTGLGLSIAYGIVKQHEGYIWACSEAGKGATFRICLPAAEALAGGTHPAGNSEVPTGGTETVLLVEDDAAVRKIEKTVLERFGYTVIEAVDGQDAIEKFAGNRDKVKLLILDVIMPRMNGKEAYDEIRRMRPGIRAIFTSGYSADIIHEKGLISGGYDYLSKPLLPSELLKKVREVLDR